MLFGPAEIGALGDDSREFTALAEVTELLVCVSCPTTRGFQLRCNSILKAAGRVFQKNWISTFWGSQVTLLLLPFLCASTHVADCGQMSYYACACVCVICLSGCVTVEKYDRTAVVLPTWLRPDFVPVTSVVMEKKKNVLSPPSRESVSKYLLMCIIWKNSDIENVRI